MEFLNKKYIHNSDGIKPVGKQSLDGFKTQGRLKWISRTKVMLNGLH
jgi:hypothetical protein